MPHKDPEARKAYLQQYQKDHRDFLLAQKRKYYAEHRDEARELNRRYRQDNVVKIRQIRRQYAHGLTPAKYDAMFQQQGGVCAVCKRPSDRDLFVDHDHATGKVRGLLCHRCNIMLGNARDCPDTLRAGAVYLDGFKE